MNSMHVRWHRLAVRDLVGVVDYYNQQRAGLGDELAREIDIAIARLCNDPDTFPVVRGKVRRVRVDRFPYDVLYQVYTGMVQIVVVRHHKRRPGYGLRRK
jgi:plasmid stabilization system protein ParE